MDLPLPFLQRETDLTQSASPILAGSVSFSLVLASVCRSRPTSFLYRLIPRPKVRETHQYHLRASRRLRASCVYLLSRLYTFNRSLHTSSTRFGVFWAFFSNTSRITTASLSILYMILHARSPSGILSSWHAGPIPRIGRDPGKPIFSPRCRRLNRNPASSRAAAEKGGDFTSPWSHTNGLSFGLMEFRICQI